MRILLVHNSYGRHSGEEAVLEKIQAILAARGHRLSLFARHSVEIEKMRLGKVRALLRGLHSFEAVSAFLRQIADDQPEVVHVHNLYPLISASILPVCRSAGIPVVMTVHNYRLVCPTGLHTRRGRPCDACCGGREYWCALYNCERSFGKSMAYALRNWAARVRRAYLDNVTLYASLTRFQRRRLIEAGYPEDRIVVIPNMADAMEADAPPSIGEYVGYAGRISPEKSIPTLLEAARANPLISFRAAGACDRQPGLAAFAPSNFQFLGHLGPEELRRFYDSTRILVLCSTCFEGFPTVLVEAMLHRKPVICSRIGGLPEIVEDGKTGLLFEPGNAKELAEKIRHLWERPDLCRKMGEAGREKALREYSSEKYYERLMALYQRAVQLGPAGPRLARAA